VLTVAAGETAAVTIYPAAFINVNGWKFINSDEAEFVVTFTDIEFTWEVTKGAGGWSSHQGKGFTITFSSVIPVSDGTSPYANGFTFTGTLSNNTVDWMWKDDDASDINGRTGGTFKLTWYMHDNGGSIQDKDSSIFVKQ
jgi:hypothetical protein